MHKPTSPWQPSTNLKGSLTEAREILAGCATAVVLTGAGVSTDSGVPDYRGPRSLRATPMLFDEFTGDPVAQQRYWARNYQGWVHFGQARPNLAHHAIADWERRGEPTALVGLITQNVDGLHEAAGSLRTVALHGRGGQVICLNCHQITTRAQLQPRLAELNPEVELKTMIEHAELRPDADAVVEDWQGFRVPPCLNCGGVLKPDVVFFGEPVPKDRVRVATAWCQAADALLVAGSSLTVMSGLRFARMMAKAGKPIIIFNHGATRADELATVRLDVRVGDALAELTGVAAK